MRPWTVTAGGISIAVRLTPKAGRDAIEGMEQLADGRSVLKVKARATPSEGEANDALIRVLPSLLGVARRDVVLVARAKARLKRLTIAGDGPRLAAALEKIAGLR